MTEETEDLKNKKHVCQVAQNVLRNKPLIVWGSGATVPHELPSMENLNDKLGDKVKGFRRGANLEDELSKRKYENEKKMNEIRKIIYAAVNEQDTKFMQKVIARDDHHNGIEKMLDAFMRSHPKSLTIVTTNYDRVLEHVMAWNKIPFTDGFAGKAFSSFDESLLEKNKSVALIKAHGSLNWFEIGGEARYLPNGFDESLLIPKIIPPGKRKFEHSEGEPFRSLIRIADKKIEEAFCFLVVGFGFNDRHITETLEKYIKGENGKPILLITKNATESAKKKLREAKVYLMLESEGDEKTKATFKERNDKNESCRIIEGNYWQLPKFMEFFSS